MGFFKTKKSTTPTHRSPSPRQKTPKNKTDKKIRIEEPKREGFAQRIIKTNTVDMLLRTALNQDILDINKAVTHFLVKKKTTFNNYVSYKLDFSQKLQNPGISLVIKCES